MKHPMQPVQYVDDVIRFKENAIVRFLQEFATQRGRDLDSLATMPFTKDDWTQFMQLLGYSISGAGDLSYFDRKVLAQADAEAAKLFKKRKRKR